MTQSELPDKTQEQEIQQRQEKVFFLLVQGLTETEIAKRLGVLRETIVTDVIYLKSLAIPWAADLAKGGFQFANMLAMDKFKENERGYRKMLERGNLTISEEIRIRGAIEDNIAHHIQLLGEGPTLDSLNKIVSQHDRPLPKSEPPFRSTSGSTELKIS